jgi:hypothetical protein
MDHRAGPAKHTTQAHVKTLAGQVFSLGFWVLHTKSGQCCQKKQYKTKQCHTNMLVNASAMTQAPCHAHKATSQPMICLSNVQTAAFVVPRSNMLHTHLQSAYLALSRPDTSTP